jgi:hypothetical protein
MLKLSHHLSHWQKNINYGQTQARQNDPFSRVGVKKHNVPVQGTLLQYGVLACFRPLNIRCSGNTNEDMTLKLNTKKAIK